MAAWEYMGKQWYSGKGEGYERDNSPSSSSHMGTGETSLESTTSQGASRRLKCLEMSRITNARVTVTKQRWVCVMSSLCEQL